MRSVIWLLVAIIGLRLVLHGVLYAAGFQSLTADEFARVVQAAHWAAHPFWQTQGAWLPLYPCLYGAALWVWGDLVWSPRVLTVLFGVAGIVAMVLLTRTVARSWALGLVAGLLLAVDPGHLWVSATPLSAAAYAAFVIAALAALASHARSGSTSTALLGATLLALACGLQYEGWMVAAGCSALLLFRAARGAIPGRTRVAALVAALLPWTIPSLWLASQGLATGDPLAFMHAIRDYKLTWYGAQRDYAVYLRTFLHLDPFATVLAPIGCVLALRAAQRDVVAAAMALVWMVALGMFIFLHGGQVEPVNNSVRYLGSFLFLSYPLACLALARIDATKWRPAIAVLALVVLGWQIRGALAFVPDGNAVGLAVGQRLRQLRDADGVTPPRSAVVELSYWAYLAVHVGANDVDRILYDRPIDLERRASKSLIFWDWPAMRACIARYDVGYFVARTPELRALLHKRLGTPDGIAVNDWEIVPVPQPVRDDARTAEPAACPLPMG